MELRVHGGQPYLWADEAPERVAKLRAGEVLVVPFEKQGPRRVSAGLVHHWIGAAFIPETTILNVLQVVRDYGNYRDLYRPGVVSAKTILKSEDRDQFSTVLVNKAFLLKSAFETEYESCYFRPDPRRFYGVTRSTRIQEIEQYGTDRQRLLPVGEGSGVMWRLFSITRYLERDGGVYVEVEAMGLTREIPSSLRWVVEPIVKRVSRSALSISLGQTGKAARGVAEMAKREGSAVAASQALQTK